MVFLLSPIVSVLISLKNFRAPWVKNIVWAFIVFYGFNFVIYDELMDANRYAEKIVILHQTDVSFDNFFGLFLSDEESSYLDVAAPMISFVISCFTDKPAILFGIYALIFGFFYSRNIWFLLDRTKGRIDPAALILLIAILLIVPFWSINGFRFWTATQVFIYGMLPYLFFGKKKKYLLISGASVLFHFSFLLPMAVLCFSYTYTKNLSILFIAFLASFMFSFAELKPIQDFLIQYAPGFLHKKLTTYLSDNFAENIEIASASAKWFVTMKSQALNTLTLVLVSLSFIFHRRYIKENPVFLHSFCLILYLSIVNNALSSIPSVGRFLILNSYFTFCFAFLLIQKDARQFVWLRRAVYLSLPLLGVFVMYTLRIGAQTINVLVLTGNPVLNIGDPGRALLDFFKK